MSLNQTHVSIGDTSMKQLFLLFVIFSIFWSCSSNQHVDIPDENLAQAIRDALDLNPNSLIPQDKLIELEHLTARQKNIKDLTGLDKATKLKTLLINNNQIKDIRPLAGLSNLTVIYLSNNQIRDITPLSNLTGLKYLLLEENQINDISPLEKLNQLKFISLHKNHISDLSPLTNLTQLTYLSLQENQINDISPLRGLIRLNFCSLNENRITDITPLAQLRELYGLHLSKNHITDIKPISLSTNLFDLRLNHNQIRDFSPIEGIKKLEVLDFKENPIEDMGPIHNLLLQKPDLVIDVQLPDLMSKDDVRIGLPAEVNVRLGKGGINVMRFSPDGTKLAVGSSIGVWIYDIESGEELTLEIRKPQQFTALAYSLDGKTIAACGLNSYIHLWASETGKLLSVFHRSADITSRLGLSRIVYSPGSELAFSKDGKTIIGLRSDDFIGVLTYWDITTKSLMALHYGIERDGKATLNANHNTIAVGRADGKISIWDLQLKDLTPHLNRISLLNGHRRLLFWESITNRFKKYPKNTDQSIRTLAISPDGKTLISTGRKNAVKIWDITKGRDNVITDRNTTWTSAFAFSNDGKTIAIGTGVSIRLWNLTTNTELSTLKGHKGTIESLTFSSDGKTLASGSRDGTVRFWNVKTGNQLSTVINGHTEHVKTVAFSPDDKILACAGTNKYVQKWDIESGRELTPFAAEKGNTFTAIFSPNANLFATQSRNKIHLWDLETNQELPTITHDSSPKKIYPRIFSFSPIHKTLACDTYAPYPNIPVCHLWNVQSGEIIYTFKPNPEMQKANGHIGAIAFSSDGSKLAVSVGYNVKSENRIHIWDVKSLQKLTTLPGDADILVFSKDNTLLAAKDWNNISLWNINAANEMELKRTFWEKVATEIVLFAPDNTMILTVNYKSHEIHFWDIITGNELLTLSMGHTAPIETLVFSHDGQTLVSAGEDGTVLLWEWEKILSKIKPDDR